MKSEKRMVGDYTVLCAVNIGSREIILGGNAEIAETSGTLLFQPVPVGADVRIVVDIHCLKDLMTWRLRTLTLPPSGQKEIILYYLMR